MKTEVLPFEPRTRFEGMVNILRFNWPFYLRALVIALGVGIFMAIFDLPFTIKVLGGGAALGCVFYLIVSLVVSHWVYDRSTLYDLSWLDRAMTKSPRHIVNFTAGFDETTLRLKSKFPNAKIEVLDFYDPRFHTEPSIARARAFQPPLPETISVSLGHFELEPESVDLVLGILALHEIRQTKERDVLFQSISNALRPEGRCVIVEHLRDMPNFLAFGPGFFHFFPRKAWLNAAQAQSFLLVDEFTLTPFVRVFVLEKNDA